MQELEPEELLQVKIFGVKYLQLTFQRDTAGPCNVDYVKIGSSRLKDSGTLLVMYDGLVKRSLGFA